MLKRHGLFSATIAFLIMTCLTGCKKESVCSEIEATLNNTSIELGCFPLSGCNLDGNYFTLETIRPTQTMAAQYDLLLHFKNQLGIQILDTATNNVLSGSYIKFYKNCCISGKTYSLYSSVTSGTIIVTEINESSKTIRGNFSATLCEKDSINDIIQIMDGSFSAQYQ